MTFGKRTRQVTDAQVLLLAGSQHRCLVDRADALKEWLRCVGIFDWKDGRKKGEKKECREWYETRPSGWEYSLNWTLTVQTCCLELLLNTRAQACSEALWRPRESHSMTIWCLGRSLHCPVLSVKGQKSKLPWNLAKRSWGQPAVKTCDDVHDWRGVSDEDFDGLDDEKSTTILQASGRGNLLWFGRSPAVQATDRRHWRGTAPACDRLSESISLLFWSL